MDLITGIAAITETLKITKELRNIDSKVDVANLKLRLSDLIDSLLDAKEALQDAKADRQELIDKIASLEAKINQKSKLEDDEGKLFELDDDGRRRGKPYCNHCYVKDEKLYRLVDSYYGKVPQLQVGGPKVMPSAFPNEQIVLEITADKATYNREHAVLFFIGAALMYAVLWAVGNPFPWTGIVGAVFAIFIRWIYVASVAMDVVWTLTNQRLTGPAERSIPLTSIKHARTMFSAAQIITHTGDKYMLKYLADPKTTVKTILTTRDQGMS